MMLFGNSTERITGFNDVNLTWLRGRERHRFRCHSRSQGGGNGKVGGSGGGRRGGGLGRDHGGRRRSRGGRQLGDGRSRRGSGLGMLAHAAFNEEHHQQSNDGGDDDYYSPAKALAAAQLYVRPLQAGRDLKRIRRVHMHTKWQ